MEHLEKLSKVLRYAGLNLTPQLLSVVLDKNVRNLVDTLNGRLQEEPNLSLDAIDEIINAIQDAAEKQLAAEAVSKTPKSKPALEKA